jgi:hypothetical protein
MSNRAIRKIIIPTSGFTKIIFIPAAKNLGAISPATSIVSYAFIHPKVCPNIEAKLPQKDFIRIHRSFIVSFCSISSFTNEYVEINNHQIPISRTFKKDALIKLENE